MLQFKNDKIHFSYKGRLYTWSVYVNFVTGVKILKASQENAKEMAELISSIIVDDHQTLEFWIMVNSVLGKDIRMSIAINSVNFSRQETSDSLVIYMNRDRLQFRLEGYPLTKKGIRSSYVQYLVKDKNSQSLTTFITELLYHVNRLHKRGGRHDYNSKK